MRKGRKTCEILIKKLIKKIQLKIQRLPENNKTYKNKNKKNKKKQL
jgi:hypothetical protein